MKYIVLIGDGMADRPVKELGGLTPLQKADTTNMDKLAASGIIGMVNTIPDGFPPGSDVANLSILGYDPEKFYSGRAPLEAASMGVAIGNNDVAYRCNLVCLENDNNNKTIMKDYSAGHISTGEAGELIKSVNAELSNSTFSFYPGVSYRHLLVWKDGVAEMECTPPHDISGKEVEPHLPIGENRELLRELMAEANRVLEQHPVNKQRIKEGKSPGNNIWLWGQGKKPDLPTFPDRYGVTGSLISAVDLTKGLGVYSGLKVINVPGATGYLDTNYKGKAQYGINSLKEHDFVYIHVEAPDEAGHTGNLEHKIQAIEDFDKLVVGEVLRLSRELKEFKILLMPDHATPLEIKTHSDEPVPFVIYNSTELRDNKECTYNESIKLRNDIKEIKEGHRLMDYFMDKNS